MDLPGLSMSTPAYDRYEDCVVISPSGRAEIADVTWSRQLLELTEAHGRGRIIIDLSRLSSIDWWAMFILLWADRMVSLRGGTMVLASPQPAVAQRLKAVPAAQAVEVYQSVRQAYRRRTRRRECDSGRR